MNIDYKNSINVINKEKLKDLLVEMIKYKKAIIFGKGPSLFYIDKEENEDKFFICINNTINFIKKCDYEYYHGNKIILSDSIYDTLKSEFYNKRVSDLNLALDRNNLDNSLPGGGSLFAVGAQADTAALQARKHEQQQEYAAQLQNDKLRHARERDMEMERKMRQDRNNNFNNNDNNNNNGFAGNNNDDDMNQRNKLAQQAQYAAKLQQDQLLKQKQQRNASQGSIPGGGMLNIGAADGVRSHSNANNDQALLLKRQKQAEYQRQLDDDKHNNNMNDHNYIYNQKNDFDGGAMQIGDGTAEVNAKKYDKKQLISSM